ncbi:apolipoprotein N-acyltransferase [Microbacterium phosphatis]|uniref:apolipoprotein N-acyltransferase n=1 Tax=Microbacterium phosphatis TaxID=3140248 RepID=UPI003BA3BE30
MPSTAPSPTETAHPVERAPAARPLLPLRFALLAALLGGVILDLAYPSVGWWPAAFIAIALALVSLIGRSARGALGIGLVFGAAFFPLHLVWVAEFLGPLPWVALSGLQAALFAAGSVPITLAYRWAHRFPRRSRWALTALLVGGAWTLREIAMGSWPYTGFPWARIGLSQASGPLADLASWMGIGGLSLLIVGLCAAAIEAARDGAFRSLWTSASLAGALAALVLVPPFPTTPSGSLRIGWVQANGPSAYFDNRAAGDILRAQLAATEPLLGAPMDLLVWPEGSVDSDPLNTPATAAILDETVRRAGAPLLVNAATERDGSTYNTSLLWTGKKAPQPHDKANPVPFGEYVPDRWLYETIAPDLIGMIQREYAPGNNAPVVALDDRTLGLAICFDVIYDDVIRAGALGGAQAYVFQTNNADFRGTDENLQQLAIARMRAIETGRTVVNVSTTGTSQVIGADGRVIDEVPAAEAAARITTVPLHTGVTAGVLLGPWITGVAVAGSVATLLLLPLIPRLPAVLACRDREWRAS